MLVSHVTALGADGLTDPDIQSLAARAGGALYWQGDYGGAQALLVQLVTARRELLVPHHPDTLTSANNLAETPPGPRRP